MVWGIDFGTSTSLLSYTARNAVRTLKLGSLDNWMPSVLARREERWLVGDEATDYAGRNVIRGIKRRITEGNHETVSYFDGQRERTESVDEAILAILKKVRRRGQTELGADSNEARFGCPADWDGAKRKRLVGLAEQAGFEVVNQQLVDEPIAACISWVQDQLADGKAVAGQVLVFDMGGGTLDVALVDVRAEPGLKPSFFVKSTAGKPIAGEKIDEEIANYFLAQSKLRILETGGSRIDPWLLGSAREIKEALSSRLEHVSALIHPKHGQINLSLTRVELEEIALPLLTQTWETVEKALYLAEFTNSQTGAVSRHAAIQGFLDSALDKVDYVVLAGGMARMPLVAELFARKGVPSHKIHIAGESVGNPNEAISLGLAEDLEPDKLNLARPSFDLVFSWHQDSTGDHGEEKIYSAYSPLYESTSTEGYPCFRWTSKANIPPTAVVDLKVIDPRGGEELEFRVKDTRETTDICFRMHDFKHLVLYPSGYMIVRHAGTDRIRVVNWPFGRFNRFVDIEVFKEYEPYQPVPMDDLR